MHPNILSEYFLFINHQIISQEKLLECHLKADSLLKVILESDLSNHSHLTIHNYLWAVNDFVDQAKTLNESLLNILLNIINRSKQPPSGDETLH